MELLLHTIDARSGAERVNPMMYMADQGRYLVFASRAGDHRHPDWFHNLLVHPDARIEVGDETLAVHAVELMGQERTAYAEQARRYPGFAGYQDMTDRVIPVVALTLTDSTAS